jgi:hypothetical protein
MAVATGMRFTVLADFFTFDEKKFTNKVKEATRKVIRNAAKEWLRMVLSRIPRQTGFLHSAFTNLMTDLGVTVTGKGTSNSKILNRPSYDARKFRLQKMRDNLRRIRQELKDYEGSRKKMSQKQVRQEVKKYKAGKKSKADERRKKLDEAREKVNRVRSENSKQDRKQAIRNARIKEAGSIRSIGEERVKLSRSEFKNTKMQEFYTKQRQGKAYLKRVARYKSAIKRYREMIKKFDRAQQKELKAIIEQQGDYKTRGRLLEKRKIYNKRFRQTNKRGEAYGYSRKYEKVRVVTRVKEIRTVTNPKYMSEYANWIRNKKQGPPPSKTIQKTVIVEKERFQRKRIPHTRLFDLYTKYYYTGPKQKGPLKTPRSGAIYGTPPGKIFLEQSVGTVPKQYGETQYGDVKDPVATRNKTFATLGGNAFTLGGSQKEASRRLNTGENFTVAFNYNIAVSYYRVMDLFRSYTRKKKTISPAGVPWQSMAYANKAFLQYIEEHLPKEIPNFLDFLSKNKVDFSTKGSSVYTKQVKF